MRKHHSYSLALAAAFALAACAGAPVTDTTKTFCANVPMVRTAEDFAQAVATNPPTAAALAGIRLARADVDARCAAAGMPTAPVVPSPPK